MSERFYVAGPIELGEFAITGAEAHHIATVRRFADGDRITLFNGSGSEYTAEVVHAAKKSISLNVLAALPVDRELPYPIVVASALPKGDRADFLIEKLTELGVARFIPLVTVRSVVIPKAATVEKFRRAVIEASKQCGRNRLMAIDDPWKWDAYLKCDTGPSLRYIFDTRTQSGRARIESGGSPVVVAIGPEGGFAPEEVIAATDAGWQALSLGPRILRMETAAVVVAALLAQATSQ